MLRPGLKRETEEKQKRQDNGTSGWGPFPSRQGVWSEGHAARLGARRFDLGDGCPGVSFKIT